MALRSRTWRRVALAVSLCLCLGIAMAGCGSSTSKPAFCANLSSLKHSVSSISVSGGLSSVKTQLSEIESTVKSLSPSAKHDFPDQTTALDNAVTKLQGGVKAASSSPTPSQLAAVAGDVKSLGSAISDFVSASHSKCQ